MRKMMLSILLGCMLAPALTLADDDEKNDLGREIGAVLAWRLGPETLEERCQSFDPAGTEVRKKALKNWLEKNAALIKEVDDRVAEVVPLIYKPPANVDVVHAIRAQVKAILLESIFEGKDASASTAICKEEADPAGPRWNNPGMPQVPESLAALYDWKVRQAKP